MAMLTSYVTNYQRVTRKRSSGSIRFARLTPGRFATCWDGSSVTDTDAIRIYIYIIYIYVCVHPCKCIYRVCVYFIYDIIMFHISKTYIPIPIQIPVCCCRLLVEASSGTTSFAQFWVEGAGEMQGVGR